MRRTLMRRWLITTLLLGVATAAHGQVVIYRCTDASGALTIQNNTPCPKGSTQQRRVVEAAPVGSPPPFASPARSTAPVAPSRPAEHAQPSSAKVEPANIPDAERLPPPVLYECRTYDNGIYLSDDGHPPQRCAPLRVTGLGGGGDRAGATAACQMVDDQCQRIPDGALCVNWKQRLREAESQLRFGVVQQRDQAQADVERMQRIVRESTCGR
jgi:hypothetical protein